MSKQNNSLLINIIKNSGPDFKFRDELIQLHSRCLQLESSINLRKRIEYEYNTLKLEEVKERIDEIKFQKKFYIKRNNDILNDIQKRNLKSLEASSQNLDIFNNIQKQKKKYGDYISYLMPKIQTEFNIELHKDSNKLEIQKKLESKILKNMKCKNEYYEEMAKANEKLGNEMSYLQKKKMEYEIKNKQKEGKYSESKKKLQNQIDNFKIEEEKNEFDINEYIGSNNNKNINNLNNIKNEMDKINLERNQISSEKASFEDLNKQIVNPNKIDFDKNTINQNFDMPRPEFDFSKSKINENIENKFKLVDQLDEDMINKPNNNDINQINLINSGEIKYNLNNINNKISYNMNIINNDVNLDLNINNNGVKELDKKSEKDDDGEFSGYIVEDK